MRFIHSAFFQKDVTVLTKEKVLVAMSGGVDSSAAAALLSRDYIAVGATMRLYTNEDIVF